MMITSDQYVECFIDSKDEEGVLKAIKNLRSQISRLKHVIKHGDGTGILKQTHPSLETQLSCSWEYLEASIQEYLRRFGDDEEHRRKVYTRSDCRDMQFVSNISRIMRITYTKEYRKDGVLKSCEYTADFSVNPLVTFRFERNAGEVTLDDELFHSYQALQDKVSTMPADVQLENLKTLRKKMLETRKARVIGGTKYYDERYQRETTLEGMSDMAIGRWKKSYSAKPSPELDDTFDHFDSFSMHGVLSWSLKVDYRNDIQYLGIFDEEDSRKDPVQPFVSGGTNDEPYNMDELRDLLEFTDDER
ncbi:MAG: hypothetical protein LUE27_02155 [Clostridia bacterium]|nr:hypothetical protein [Clostridia bacterium]